MYVMILPPFSAVRFLQGKGSMCKDRPHVSRGVVLCQRVSQGRKAQILMKNGFNRRRAPSAGALLSDIVRCCMIILACCPR